MNENKKEYEEKWFTPEMFSEGWHELRNGIIYHHSFSVGDIIRRDEHGNLLVRIKTPLKAGAK